MLIKKLNDLKSYFDNMFKQIDPNIILDIEQRKAIIIDEDYSLIIAGAGSGKTTTMVAKVKYLIEKRHIDPRSIILLSRFNSELDSLLESNLFYKENKTDDKIICKKVPDLNLTFLTIHKSKGLGFDRVILLNGINGTNGFPSKIKDEPLIKYLKGEYDLNDNIKDLIEYPEERRLFYVALTRTKNELYIMVPSIYKYKSDFIKEIESNSNVVSIN